MTNIFNDMKYLSYSWQNYYFIFYIFSINFYLFIFSLLTANVTIAEPMEIAEFHPTPI